MQQGLISRRCRPHRWESYAELNQGQGSEYRECVIRAVEEDNEGGHNEDAHIQKIAGSVEAGNHLSTPVGKV